jgi:hypothetical protein
MGILSLVVTLLRGTGINNVDGGALDNYNAEYYNAGPGVEGWHQLSMTRMTEQEGQQGVKDIGMWCTTASTSASSSATMTSG